MKKGWNRLKSVPPFLRRLDLRASFITPAAKKMELEEIEVALLLEGLLRRYGIDLRDYERGFLRWRIDECMRSEGVRTVSGFQERVLREEESLERLLLALSDPSAVMFRDPAFYIAFRARVVPLLR